MADVKNHPDVIDYMATFSKLRQRVDDDASNLELLAAQDESIRDLCLKSKRSAISLAIAGGSITDRASARRGTLSAP